MKDKQDSHHDWRARVAKLEAEVEELEDRLALEGTLAAERTCDRCELRGRDDAALDRVRGLMREAEFRGGAVTVEQLADAIAGHHVFF